MTDLSVKVAQIASAEVEKPFATKWAITKVTYDVAQFILTIFTRPKRDKSHI